jgi:endonuclease/exonuclease/phosphatase family metal-dependent hydrolase
VAGRQPLVLAGDFNSAADGGELSSPTYGLLLESGLTDVWRAVATDPDGATWGQANDLANKESTLDQRLDLVLTGTGVRPLAMERVGHRPEDRIPSGLWPSDHAGLTADLEIG